MLTREYWDSLTEQEKWDYAYAASVELAARDELADDDGATERVPVIDDEDMTYENGW